MATKEDPFEVKRVSYKIVDIVEGNDLVVVSVEFTDKSKTWHKAFRYSRTSPITEEQFNDRMKEEIERDLSIKTAVQTLEAIKGKTVALDFMIPKKEL